MHYSDPFRLDDLDALTENSTGPCVSIYLPTHEITQHTPEDQIRLKNLRNQAFDALLNLSVKRSDAEAYMAPVDHLFSEASRETFWPYLSDGLAIFLSPQIHSILRLPIRFEPMVRVSHRFFVKPLFPLLSDDGTFAILAISRNEIRLFEGTRNTVREVEIKDLPASMSEALNIRHRPNLSPSGPLQGDEGQKELYRQYFHQVDRAIRPWLNVRKAPLVLAGVDSIVTIFKQASSYRRIVDASLHGNPESLRADQLHDQAWPLVEPYFLQPRTEAIAKYQALAGTGKTSDDLVAIVHAARDGRVDTLFVRSSAESFGQCDDQSRTITPSRADERGTIDLVARATRLAHHAGAKIFEGEPPHIPNCSAVAAIYRY